MDYSICMFNLMLQPTRKFERQRKECLDRITSEKGVQLRVNRSIQAEGAFALWKEDQKFRQFLCRGQANVYADRTAFVRSLSR